MVERAPHRPSRDTGLQPRPSSARANPFVTLLQGPTALVLPSAWGAGSARVVEQAGAAAVAVSAAGVAWSLGASGARALRTQELVAACERICKSIAIPVTVDLRGASDDAKDLPALAEALLSRGVAGLVLPDARRQDADRRLLDAVRAAGGQSDVRLHVTAHVNAGDAPRSTRSARAEHWREVVRRARACSDAGADGTLVTGLDWAEVMALVRELPTPVGVDVGDGWGPPVHGLARGGVRWVALGLGPLRAAVDALRRVTSEAHERGSYESMNGVRASIDGTYDLA